MNKIVSDYKNIDSLRYSFNELARIVFGIDFENWFQKGFWNEFYKCYSITVNDEVISNVSTSEIEVVLNGETKKAIQIGTVMTHPGFRGQGMADQLMKLVIDKYKREVDLIYLFPNESVMSFYPKYGFHNFFDVYYSVDIKNINKRPPSLRKIIVNDDSELWRFYDAVNTKKCISNCFDTNKTSSIYMWHYLNDLYGNIYRIGNTDDYLVYDEDESKMHLYDIISKEQYDLRNILEIIGFNGKKDLCLHFLPIEFEMQSMTYREHKNEEMFIYQFKPEKTFAHQLMAHT